MISWITKDINVIYYIIHLKTEKGKFYMKQLISHIFKEDLGNISYIIRYSYILECMLITN